MALDLKQAAPDWAPPDPRQENFRLPTARGVLSAQEIEMLLRPDIPEDAFEPPVDAVDHNIADLGEATAGASLLEDAGSLAARLTFAIRKACGVDAVFKAHAANAAPFSALVREAGPSPVLIAFQDEAGFVKAGLTLDTTLAMALIDFACGGKPIQGNMDCDRRLTALDRLMLEKLLQPLASCFDPGFSIACVESDTVAASALLPPGPGMVASLDCKLAGLAGSAAFARLDDPSADQSIGAHAPSALQATLVARIASLQVPVSRLADLKAGSTLLLGLPTDQPVELLSGNRSGPLAAEGEIGRKGSRMAVRITRRGPVLCP